MGHPGMLRCNASPSARFLRCLLTHLSALRELLECALPTGRRKPLRLALAAGLGAAGPPLTLSAGRPSGRLGGRWTLLGPPLTLSAGRPPGRMTLPGPPPGRLGRVCG